MITLYHVPGSCSLAVKAALKLCGLSYDIKTLNAQDGEQFTEEYLKINPLGKVPALAIEGEVLTESAAIMQYLDEISPNTQLLPPAGSLDRANALRWVMFVYSNLHPHFGRLFFPVRFGDDEDDIKIKAEKSIHDLFAIIDAQLAINKYISGQSITIADLYLGVAINWQIAMREPLTEKYPNVASYMQRLMEHPEIGEVYKEEVS